MPTPSNEKYPPTTLSNDEPIESPTVDLSEKEDLIESTSEVSKRINLLGKLIIPPVSR